MNYKLIGTIMGSLLLLLALCLLLPVGIALHYGERTVFGFVWPALAAMAIGLTLRGPATISEPTTRDALAIVGLGWLTFALLGSLPLHASGVFPSYVDALFEAMCGVTTSGASVITDYDTVPYSIMFWRSLMQWLGGMGFIVLSLAVLPRLALGGMELFKAEVATPLPERLVPRLRDTARFMWRLYVVGTIVLTALLMLAGMSWFDAVTHALSTMPAGGFSTKSTSIAAFDNVYVELILLVFMFLAGTNYALYYRALHHRDWREITKDREFRVYASIQGAAVLVVTWTLWSQGTFAAADALRHGSFQIVSFMSTTAFASTDYNTWPPLATALLFMLMFVGGSSGSTAGGIKVVRHMVAVKHAYRELFRLVHPRAIRTIRVGDGTVKEPVIASILAFLLLYVALFFCGALALIALSVDTVTAVTASAAAISNIGPGFGAVGPMSNFAGLPSLAKLILSGLMFVGRLEISTVLALFVPALWVPGRRN